MRRYLLLLMCMPLLGSPWTFSGGPWSTTDTVLEATSMLMIAAEWRQTQYVVKKAEPHNYITCYDGQPMSVYGSEMAINGIDAKIFGEKPRMRNVNLYFLAWEVAHPVISYALPRPCRRFWQVGTISFEAYALSQNYKFGCRITF